MARIPKSASMYQKKHYLGDMSMPVDVDAYVDHFYIHYKMQSAQHLVAPTTAWYTYRTSMIFNNMKADSAAQITQAQTLMTQMNENATAAKSSMQIIKALNEGPLIEATLDSIATAINALLVEKYNSVIEGQSYENAVSSISDQFSSMLANGPANDASKFFGYIKQALNLVNAIPNKSELRALDALQKIFEGKTSYNDGMSLISLNTIGIASQVVELLSNAAKTLSISGSVSKNSFASTIAKIFSKTIGEPLAGRMVKNVLFQISDETDQVFDSLINKSKGKLKWDSGNQNKSSSGLRSTRTASIDIISNGLFNLKVTLQDGTTAVIEIATNSALVDWQFSKPKSLRIQGKTKLQTFLENESPNRQQYAYNIIAHRLSGGGRGGEFFQAYNAIRSTIAASYFNEWVKGSEGQLGLNKAQFLVYNGKIYSIMSIINKICENTLKGLSTEVRGFSTIDSKVDNKFVPVGEEYPTPAEAATHRSQMVRDAINALIISVDLNPNILKSFLY